MVILVPEVNSYNSGLNIFREMIFIRLCLRILNRYTILKLSDTYWPTFKLSHGVRDDVFLSTIAFF